MNNHIVNVTFDFDAISLWLARGMDTPGPISRGEFGAHAIPRILDMLEKRRIRATFFIPGHTVETYPEECLRIHEAGHEVALHGYCHEPVSTLSREREKEVVTRSAEAIEQLTGVRPVGHRTPSFDFTENTIEIIEDLGCDYDSSLMGTDYTPYVPRRGDRPWTDGPYEFGEPSGIVELPVSWTLDDYPYLEFVRAPGYVMPGLRPVREMFAGFHADIVYMVERETHGVCNLTFHPQVIGRGGRMLAFESFLDGLKELPVDFATCKETAALARKRM